MVISHSFRTSAVLGIGFGTSLGHQLPIRQEELVSVRSSRRRFWKSLASEKGERCSLPLGFRAPEKLRPSQGHCNDNVSIWTQRPKRAIYFEVFDSSNVELKHQTQRSCWSSCLYVGRVWVAMMGLHIDGANKRDSGDPLCGFSQWMVGEW